MTLLSRSPKPGVAVIRLMISFLNISSSSKLKSLREKVIFSPFVILNISLIRAEDDLHVRRSAGINVSHPTHDVLEARAVGYIVCQHEAVGATEKVASNFEDFPVPSCMHLCTRKVAPSVTKDKEALGTENRPKIMSKLYNIHTNNTCC